MLIYLNIPAKENSKLFFLFNYKDFFQVISFFSISVFKNEKVKEKKIYMERQKHEIPETIILERACPRWEKDFLPISSDNLWNYEQFSEVVSWNFCILPFSIISGLSLGVILKYVRKVSRKKIFRKILGTYLMDGPLW